MLSSAKLPHGASGAPPSGASGRTEARPVAPGWCNGKPLAQNHAAELRLRAERKAGELLAELERDKGGSGKFGTVHSSLEQTVSPYRTVLTENDIAPTTAHRWQVV